MRFIYNNYVYVWYSIVSDSLGSVWYMCLNAYFQFFNNITRIFTHFYIYIYIYIEREREREILLSTEYISSIPLEIVYLSMILSKGLKIPSLHVNTK